MRDVEEKIKKYRNIIAGELMRNGIYPDDISIKKRLEPIDEKLAMFQYIREAEGEAFDIEKYNTDMRLIYEDLEILYRLVYEFCVEKYETLKSYVDLHLTELENMARQYSSKTDFEIGSTSLGNTAYFQASGFDIDRENSTAIVNIGTVYVTPGARIACIYKGNSMDEDVRFKVGDDICTPYSYNNDYIKIPGALRKVSYGFTKGDDINSEEAVPMIIDNLIPYEDNTYVIYAGKDSVKNTASTESIVKKYNGSTAYFPEAGRISFYVKGGSFIRFSFSEQPINTNFSGYVIEDMEDCQKITIDHNNGFTMDYDTDGTVYAEKKTGVINDGILYFPSGIDTETFLVEEYMKNEKIPVEVSVTINNLTINQTPVIDMIALKELNTEELPK